jgi:hypothetical protein
MEAELRAQLDHSPTSAWKTKKVLEQYSYDPYVENSKITQRSSLMSSTKDFKLNFSNADPYS